MSCVGVPNLGESCFVSALAHLFAPLLSFFSLPCTGIFKQLMELCRGLSFAKLDRRKLDTLVSNVRQAGFSGQCDPAELFLQMLSETGNEQIRRRFQWTVRTRRKCFSCFKVLFNTENCYTITIQAKNIADAVADYCNDQLTDIVCECGKKNVYESHDLFPSDICCFLVNRFEYSESGSFQRLCGQATIKDSMTWRERICVGMVLHDGSSPASGHYMAISRNPLYTKEFYFFNDSQTRPCSVDDEPSLVYLVFYAKRIDDALVAAVDQLDSQPASIDQSCIIQKIARDLCPLKEITDGFQNFIVLCHMRHTMLPSRFFQEQVLPKCGDKEKLVEFMVNHIRSPQCSRMFVRISMIRTIASVMRSHGVTLSNEDLLTLQFDPDCGDIFLAQYEQTDIPSSAMTSKTKTLFWSGARREGLMETVLSKETSKEALGKIVSLFGRDFDFLAASFDLLNDAKNALQESGIVVPLATPTINHDSDADDYVPGTDHDSDSDEGEDSGVMALDVEKVKPCRFNTKNPPKMCVFCGRFVTRIRDHIMRVHTAEPTRDDEIMSALSRSSKTAKKKRCPLCSAKVLKLKRHLRQVHKTISQVEKEQALASTRRGIFYTPAAIGVEPPPDTTEGSTTEEGVTTASSTTEESVCICPIHQTPVEVPQFSNELNTIDSDGFFEYMTKGYFKRQRSERNARQVLRTVRKVFATDMKVTDILQGNTDSLERWIKKNSTWNPGTLHCYLWNISEYYTFLDYKKRLPPLMIGSVMERLRTYKNFFQDLNKKRQRSVKLHMKPIDNVVWETLYASDLWTKAQALCDDGPEMTGKQVILLRDYLMVSSVLNVAQRPEAARNLTMEEFGKPKVEAELVVLFVKDHKTGHSGPAPLAFSNKEWDGMLRYRAQRKSDSAYFFVTESGNQLCSSGVYGACQRFFRAIGVHDFNFTNHRHDVVTKVRKLYPESTASLARVMTHSVQTGTAHYEMAILPETAATISRQIQAARTQESKETSSSGRSSPPQEVDEPVTSLTDTDDEMNSNSPPNSPTIPITPPVDEDDLVEPFCQPASPKNPAKKRRIVFSPNTKAVLNKIFGSNVKPNFIRQQMTDNKKVADISSRYELDQQDWRRIRQAVLYNPKTKILRKIKNPVLGRR